MNNPFDEDHQYYRKEDWVTLKEAAAMFNLTPEAIRLRLKKPGAPFSMMVRHRLLISKGELATCDWFLDLR